MVVTEIEYIVDAMRNKGTVEVINGVPSIDLPCNVVFDCDPCLKLSDLSDGVHEWYDKAPYFYVGDLFEVQRLLAKADKNVEQKDRTKYPCIILEIPSNEIDKDTGLEADVKLILATQNKTEQTFKQRVYDNYEMVLMPLYNRLKSKIESIDTVAGNSNFSRKLLPRYSKIENDPWDAIEIKTKITFNNNCKKIKLCIQ